MSLEAFLAVVSKDDEIATALGRLRSSSAQTRRQAQKRLGAFAFADVCACALPVLRDGGVPVHEKQRVCVYLARALNRQSARTLNAGREAESVDLGAAILAQTPVLFTEEPLHTAARQLVAALCRVVGVARLARCLEPLLDVCVSDTRACRACAECLVTAAATLGVSLLLPLLRAFADAPDVPRRLVFVNCFYFLPTALLAALPAVLETLLPHFEPLLFDARIAAPAARALAHLLEHTPSSSAALFDKLRAGLALRMNQQSRHTSAYLRCLALIASKRGDQPLLQDCVAAVTRLLEPDELPALHVFLLGAASATEPERAYFFTKMFTPGKHEALAAQVAAQLVPQMPAAEVADRFRRCPASLAQQVLALEPPLAAGPLEQAVLVQLVVASEPGCAVTVSAKAGAHVARVCDAPACAQLARELIVLSKRPSDTDRERAYRVLAAVVQRVPGEEQQLVLAHLNEQLGEEFPNVVGAALGALEQYTRASGSCDPALVPRLLPVLHNRSELVQEPLVGLLQTLAAVVGDLVPAREWMRACHELLALQASPRVHVRHLASAAFARIAAVVGPAAVAGSLLAQFRSNSRQVRVTAAAAVASIGAESGLFSVLPLLLYTYSRSESENERQSILKTANFAAEFCDDLPPYVDVLLGFAEHALLTPSQSSRQTAAAIVEETAKKCVGAGLEPEFVHALNSLMPSIYETSTHVRERVQAAFRQLARVLGPGVVVQYLLAGLFHPARRVRTAYWGLFNAAYQDTPVTVLVPLYEEEDIRDLW